MEYPQFVQHLLVALFGVLGRLTLLHRELDALLEHQQVKPQEAWTGRSTPQHVTDLHDAILVYGYVDGAHL